MIHNQLFGGLSVEVTFKVNNCDLVYVFNAVLNVYCTFSLPSA